MQLRRVHQEWLNCCSIIMHLGILKMKSSSASFDSIPKEYLAIEKRQLDQYKNEKIPETEKEIERLQKIINAIEQDAKKTRPLLIK